MGKDGTDGFCYVRLIERRFSVMADWYGRYMKGVGLMLLLMNCTNRQAAR